MKQIGNTQYSVDTDGVVYNKHGEIKKASFDKKNGYLRVGLWVKHEGAKKAVLVVAPVHRLVAEAYLDNPENKPCVNHIDGVKSNNKLENLEWCTYSENTLHALATGLKIPEKGEEVHNALHTDEQAHEVCRLMQEGYRNKDIIELTNVSADFVDNIRYKGAWIHVASLYKIPKTSRRSKVSIETIEWICKMLEEGHKQFEIIKIANNPNINKNLLTRIYMGRAFKEISCKYNF